MPLGKLLLPPSPKFKVKVQYILTDLNSSVQKPVHSEFVRISESSDKMQSPAKVL